MAQQVQVGRPAGPRLDRDDGSRRAELLRKVRVDAINNRCNNSMQALLLLGDANATHPAVTKVKRAASILCHQH